MRVGEGGDAGGWMGGWVDGRMGEGKEDRMRRRRGTALTQNVFVGREEQARAARSPGQAARTTNLCWQLFFDGDVLVSQFLKGCDTRQPILRPSNPE